MLRYQVHYTHVPDEALWVSCGSYALLTRRIQEVWGSDLQPMLKYFLPSHVERGSCEVLIDDEEDFAIWRLGSGSSENPKPLTASLFVFDRRRLPLVQTTHTASSAAPSSAVGDSEYHHSREGMYHYPTVGFPLYKEVGCTVSLRHSASKDIILAGREDVTGNGLGEWGRLVIKARRAWRVQRPVFRYFDERQDESSTCVISIFTAEDYCQWSQFRRSQNPELIVFEGASRIEASPAEGAAPNLSVTKPADLGSAFVHHEVVLPAPPSTSSSALENNIHGGDRIQRAQTDAAVHTAQTYVNSTSALRLPRKGITEYEALVMRGEFGAPFTTPSNVELKRALNANTCEVGVRHHGDIVARLQRERSVNH